MSRNILQVMIQAFESIGYSESQIWHNYIYADVMEQTPTERCIPLAVFAQNPPSYRNACIGVISSNGTKGAENVVCHRALGAPLVFEIDSNIVSWWKMVDEGLPARLGETSINNINKVFISNAHSWKPESIFRAKALPTTLDMIQLDFVDVGLMPILQEMIRRKLDQLLRDTIVNAVKAISKYEKRKPNFQNLFSLLFRFIAAKVLRDRNLTGDRFADDPKIILDGVENYYWQKMTSPLRDSFHHEVLFIIWQSFQSAFNFQNLAVDDLAFIYENTFITDPNRRKFGIHSTPPQIAEYIVRKLPFELLPQDQRRVFEPCSGHGIFLISAMRRLRELLPSHTSEQEFHKYFVRNLIGIEIDSFAREVCNLGLMLADYPNPNGWNIYNDDIFTSNALDNELERANIVLCNPPFEDFIQQERDRYRDNIKYIQKPKELLRRILEKPPQLLGFILPRVFIQGTSYLDIHEKLANNYSNIEMVALPDHIFTHSDHESVLLVASGRKEMIKNIFVICRIVTEYKRDDFLNKGIEPKSETDEFRLSASKEKPLNLWIPRLSHLWKYLNDYSRFGDIVEIHRGIEWNIPLKGQHGKKNRTYLISRESGPNLFPGLYKVKGSLRQYCLSSNAYLRIEEKIMRGNAYRYDWRKRKIIANASPIMRGPWRIAAAVDETGLFATQAFHGIWPKYDLSPYFIAALINSPIANAYIYSFEGKRSNKKITLEEIPIPTPERLNIPKIDYYARIISEILKPSIIDRSINRSLNQVRKLLLQIDAEILNAYDLPPYLERELLDTFAGFERPIPVDFGEYYPKDFKGNIPLHKLLSEKFENARVNVLLEKIKPVRDKKISEMLSWLEGNL